MLATETNSADAPSWSSSSGATASPIADFIILLSYSVYVESPLLLRKDEMNGDNRLGTTQTQGLELLHARSCTTQPKTAWQTGGGFLISHSLTASSYVLVIACANLVVVVLT